MGGLDALRLKAHRQAIYRFAGRDDHEHLHGTPRV